MGQGNTTVEGDSPTRGGDACHTPGQGTGGEGGGSDWSWVPGGAQERQCGVVFCVFAGSTLFLRPATTTCHPSESLLLAASQAHRPCGAVYSVRLDGVDRTAS